VRKDFVIYTHAYSGTWNIQNDDQANCSGVVRCAHAHPPSQSDELGIRLGKGPCQFVRLLKFKCGSPHRHPIVIRRDPQQLELRFGAVEGLSYPSAFFGAVAIPATKRNTFSSHGDVCCTYVFLHID
jgi:hypothetical protein